LTIYAYILQFDLNAYKIFDQGHETTGNLGNVISLHELRDSKFYM